jgi:hypothetical protein
MSAGPMSQRTADEHAAGREALSRHMMDAVAKNVLEKGEIDLQKKFKTIKASTLARDTETDEWVVVTTIKANDGKFYEVCDLLVGWPSDALIAQLMLLDPNN